MSEFGLSEAMRWDADFRKVFTGLKAAYVTGDLGDYPMPNGSMATCRFYGLIGEPGTPPLAVADAGRPWYRIRGGTVPSRSLWHHERAHHLYRVIADRVGAELAAAVIQTAYAVRGAVNPVGGSPLSSGRRSCRKPSSASGAAMSIRSGV